MQTYRCKCGKRTMWTTDGVHECQGCEDCNTNFMKRPLKPHDFSIVKYNQNTGKSYKMCSICYELDEESYKESKIK